MARSARLKHNRENLQSVTLNFQVVFDQSLRSLGAHKSSINCVVDSIIGELLGLDSALNKYPSNSGRPSEKEISPRGQVCCILRWLTDDGRFNHTIILDDSPYWVQLVVPRSPQTLRPTPPPSHLLRYPVPRKYYYCR